MIKSFFYLFLTSFVSFCFSNVLAFDGPLKVSTQNSRYFTDNSGKIIHLSGLHTWRNFQAIGSDNFNYSNYLTYLNTNNLNYFRLWNWETSNNASGFGNNPITPMPFNKSGSQYDLTSFNQTYFDRMKSYVTQAGDKNIYVSIQLFNGWSVGSKNGDASPFTYHPFKLSNNINGINGDPNNDGNGYELNTLSNSSITNIQKAYIAKVIDTVNEFDNVLYEICNESEGGSTYIAWQKAMIDYIHTYESTKPKQHPVGLTIPYPNGNNSDLFSSNADWIAPNGNSGGYMDNPTLNTGSKVIISDTDHLWGLGGDRTWAWKSFTRGINVSYMDCYAVTGSLEAQLQCPISFNDATRTSLVTNMGYIRTYANRMNSLTTIPSSTISSTTYSLVNGTDQYLVYQPNSGSFTLNLSGTSKTYSVEWLNPSTGATSTAANITGGSSKTLTPPFSGDAVVYLQSIIAPSPTNTPTLPIASTIPTVSPTINSKFDVNKDGAVNLLDVFAVLNEIFK